MGAKLANRGRDFRKEMEMEMVIPFTSTVTVNPLLSPPGGLFFQALLMGGGGGLI